jgi:L-ribulose-5-phosphate 3-epimerase UlaE
MDGKYDRKSSYFPIIFNKNIKNAINSDDMTIRKLAVETICNKYLNKIKQLKSDKNLLNNFNYFKYV